MLGKIQSLLSNHWKSAAVAVALFGITLWLFWPTTGYDFINLDDDTYVTNNETVQGGLTAGGIGWAFRTIHKAYWLPMLWISYMADTSLFGPGPFGYHFVNVLLHALNAALVFLWLHAWTRRFWPAAFVAAFFAWHPLRVESVAWITERKDVLSGLFFLLCLLAYRRFAARTGPWRGVPLTVLMALGLMIKPVLVTLPFVLLLLDYWPLERWDASRASLRDRWKGLVLEKMPFWLLMVLFAAVTYCTQHIDGAVIPAKHAPWSQRLLTVPTAYLFYLHKTIWPARLQVIYDDILASIPQFLLAVAVLVAVTAVVVVAGRRRRALPVGWFWFLGLLVPVIGFVRVGAVHVADRFTYLPSIGLGIVLAWGAMAIGPRGRGRVPVLGGACAILLALCAFAARARLPVWRDSVTLFSRVVREAPMNALAHNNYAAALVLRGRSEEALQHFQRASELQPTRTESTANAGRLLAVLGRSEEAIALLENALRTYNPDCPHLNLALGIARAEAGDPAGAVPLIRKAIAGKPEKIVWRLELARILLDAGEEDAAEQEVRSIEREDGPGITVLEALTGYYVALWKRGEGLRAWRFFDRALEREPDNALLLNNVAWVLATDPNPPAPPEEALRLALRAFELSQGKNVTILDTLAASYAAVGQFDEAVRWAKEAESMARATGQASTAEDAARHLKEYTAGRPWRDVPAQ
ncbi:MAG: tetratricopeptide repeat protein [Kiritimatiellae bacterium]|nr:tetratricopeptide repeat protein [Kiritimatiellia bacterium]